MSAQPSERRKGRVHVTATEVPLPVEWHEGMLLVPQHFQQSSLRHELLVHYHAAAASPFHWGVRRLGFDGTAIADGVLRIDELEAVMPDGLIVSRAKKDRPELSISLKERVAELRQHPLTVHLAVVGRGRGLAIRERYSSERTDPVADELTGDGEMPLSVMRPKLELRLEDDLPPKYVSFPIAQVEFRNETFALAEQFTPPCLRVTPDLPIYRLCKELGTELRAKATFLTQEVLSPAASLSAPRMLDRKHLVHCLVGQLPAFEAVLRSDVAHPFSLYVSLCSLHGHIAGLGSDLIPPVLQPYDHNDLYGSFAEVQSKIVKAVAHGVQEAYATHPFTQADGEFQLRFETEWLGRRMLLAVKAPPGVPDQEMASWIASSIIGSRSKITPLRDRRTRGLIRKQIEADADLIPPSGVTLYVLTFDEEHFVPDEELIVVNPGDGQRRRPESIELFVRKSA